MEFNSKFRPALSGMPLLRRSTRSRIRRSGSLPDVAGKLRVDAQQGYNLLYVAYHVDHPIAVERIGWYREALRKNGRRLEDHEICCVYHAHFLDRDDDDRLQRMVHTPMSNTPPPASRQRASRPTRSPTRVTSGVRPASAISGSRPTIRAAW